MPQSLTPSSEQQQMWGSQAAVEIGNYNYAGVKSPVVDHLVQQVMQASNRDQLLIRTRALDRVLRAGYYQILTYGSDQKHFAYWNMYQQPSVQPKLSLGLDYWWVNVQKANQVTPYLKK